MRPAIRQYVREASRVDSRLWHKRINPGFVVAARSRGWVHLHPSRSRVAACRQRRAPGDVRKSVALGESGQLGCAKALERSVELVDGDVAGFQPGVIRHITY